MKKIMMMKCPEDEMLTVGSILMLAGSVIFILVSVSALAVTIITRYLEEKNRPYFPSYIDQLKLYDDRISFLKKRDSAVGIGIGIGLGAIVIGMITLFVPIV